MSDIHTHYDNLMVARNAPLEVIRAAYKTLSQKYHPDKNPTVNATRIMSIINASYDVLLDPVKRKEHDLWIIDKEKPFPESPKPKETTGNSSASRPKSKPRDATAQKTENSIPDFIKIPLRWIVSYALGGVISIGALFLLAFAVDLFTDHTPPPSPKPYTTTPPQAKSDYIRPPAAPNGSRWPTEAGYVAGYKKLHFGGLSTVKISNDQSDYDVFVKLVSLDDQEAFPVRQVYIPAYGNFTIKNVVAGRYDVRFRDLTTGALSRSEAFNLKETETPDGTRYSGMTLTLYKVQNGNMETYPLSESDF